MECTTESASADARRPCDNSATADVSLILTPAEPQIIMTNILSLIENGVTGLNLTLTLEGLKDFSEDLIEKAKEKLLPILVSAAKEELLSKQEVMERFNVCPTTLYNWSKKGYLIPVKMGRKVFYRPSDVESILLSRENY